MAYDEAWRAVTFNADSSLAGYTGVPGVPGSVSPNYGKALYRFVKVVGKRLVGRTTGVADRNKTVGICQSKPQVTGEAATIAIRGESLVFAGGVIAAGDMVTSDATGRAVTTAVVADHLGLAVEDASGADVLTTVLLRCN
jgi:hypothetical protein